MAELSEERLEELTGIVAALIRGSGPLGRNWGGIATDLITDLRAERAARAKLAEGLRANEWVGEDFDGEHRCHTCLAYPNEGHQVGCEWAALIALAEGA